MMSIDISKLYVTSILLLNTLIVMLEIFVIQLGKGPEMSSHNITDSPNFHRTTRFVGHSPDDPDGLHRTLGEDSDLDIKIYRKNGSQVRSFNKFIDIYCGGGETSSYGAN